MIVSTHVVQSYNAFCLRCVAECVEKAQAGDDRFDRWEKIQRAAALPYGTTVVKLDVDPNGRTAARLVCVRHARMIKVELGDVLIEIENAEAKSSDG